MLVSEKSLRYLIIGGRRERAGDQINRRVGGIFVKFNRISKYPLISVTNE